MDKQVNKYIQKNKFLCPIIDECLRKVKEIFGPVRTKLELFVDQEDGTEELFLLIDYHGEDRVEKLNQLDAEWFLDNMDRMRGKLNITIERF